MHRGVRVFTLEIEQVQRSTDRINWTTCIFVTNSSTKSWWTTAMIQAEIMMILSNPVLNSVSPDHLPLLVAIALQNSEGSFNFSVLKYLWSLQTRQEVIQLSWKGNKLCLFMWSGPRLSYLQVLKIALESLDSWQICGLSLILSQSCTKTVWNMTTSYYSSVYGTLLMWLI